MKNRICYLLSEAQGNEIINHLKKQKYEVAQPVIDLLMCVKQEMQVVEDGDGREFVQTKSKRKA